VTMSVNLVPNSERYIQTIEAADNRDNKGIHLLTQSAETRKRKGGNDVSSLPTMHKRRKPNQNVLV
jgi:hypothetical protein